MKKILIFLWIIIIGGSIFLTFHFIKPKIVVDHLVEQDRKITIEDKEAIQEKDVQPKNFKQFISLADQYFEKGYFDKAINNYKQGLELKLDSIETSIKLAKTYLKNNQPDKAQEVLLEIEKTKSDDLEIKILIAQSFIDQRKINEAKEIVWNLDNKNPEVKYYQGILSILFQEFTFAEKVFKEITNIKETSDPERTAILIENSKKILDAFENFSYYKEAQPIFLKTLLAKALVDNEQYQAAIPLLFDVINEKNNYRDAWIVLGYGYLNSGKYNDAIDSLKQALALEPENNQVLFFLGLSYFANDDIDRAIHFIEQADKLGYEPKTQLDLKLAELYFLKKNYKKSAEKYEKLLSLDASNIDLFSRAIWINIDKLNKPKNGLKLALAAIEAHPKDAMGYNLAGWAYTSLGDFEKAKELLNIAINLDPKLDATNLNFGWLYEKQGLALLAKEYYKKAYLLGHGNSITDLAAARFNKLSESDLKNIQVDVTAP